MSVPSASQEVVPYSKDHENAGFLGNNITLGPIDVRPLTSSGAVIKRRGIMCG
jgi:hypothetical protein